MDDEQGPGADAPLVQSSWRHGRDLAFDAGRDGKVLDASPAARAWLGERTSLAETVHPQDAPRLLKLLAGDAPARSDFRFANRAPEIGWRVFDVLATTPTPRGVVIVARDVTREQQAAGTLAAHRSVLERLATGDPLPAVLDALAQSIEAASGGARVAVLVARGADLELVAAPSLRSDVAGALSRLRGAAHADLFPAPGALTGRLAELATEHGLGFGWAAPVAGADGPLGVLLLFPGSKRFPSADEQAALAAAVPLAHVAIASHVARSDVRRATRDDPLTGVLGRQAFLEELVNLARRSRDVLGVLVVQIDGLAGVNERAGFEAGDALLNAVGSRLTATVRGRDIVGRCSGTRFAVACAALAAGASMPDFAARVEQVLAEPVVVGDALVPVSVRVGTATRRGRVDDPGAVLRDAERTIAPIPGGDAGAEVGGAGAGAPAVAAGAGPGGGPGVAPAERRRERRSGAARNDR